MDHFTEKLTVDYCLPIFGICNRSFHGRLPVCTMVHFKEGCRLLVMVHIHKDVNGVEYYVAIVGMLQHVCPLVNATCRYTACVQWMINFALLSNLQNTCSGLPHDAVSICLVEAQAGPTAC